VPEPDLPAYDAIVLAGGRSRRMGSDKTRLAVAGVPLLDRVLLAVAGAGRVVVVGEERPTALPVRWTLEQPPGGGPAAGLGAGLTQVEAEHVAVLAADLPLLSAQVVRALRLAAMGAQGAVLTDVHGVEQWACGVWRRPALRSVAARLAPGGSLRAALEPLAPARVTLAGVPWLDCDTPDDLDRARELA
jgi:molybdopterin-guanine dinucleotide biosynthesis protein A